MAAAEVSESEEEEEEAAASYGTALQPLQEGERIKKPVPLQEQTVKDAKGRYQRFHGAFTGGFSAGYFNTVGTKEGWTPSAFVSSRQKRAGRTILGPEDFMDEEDLSEFGIAPRDITTTDDFASKAKDKIKEKARQIAGVVAAIPGTTAFDDLIGPSKITVGVELLRKMGWKEGQGIGPRVKRKPRRQKPDPAVKIYGCALPPGLSEGSEDEEEEYQPENVTFAPKDVMPVDLTPKENVHGLGYKGLDPSQALFGASGREHLNLFPGGSEDTSNLIGDLRHSKGRKLGITGQAFGVGALEEEDDDIYATETLSKYDTVIKDEEPGDGLYGWTAPKQYNSKKRPEREVKYIGKILDGFSLASKSSMPSKIYPPPDLPRNYRPVHYFRPVIAAGNESHQLRKALEESTGKLESDRAQQSRHALNASQRRQRLGEAYLKGPAPSVLEYLSEKDRERLKEVKKASEQQMKVKMLPQHSQNSRFQPAPPDDASHKWQMLLGGQLANAGSSDFKPFARNPEKQKRYENFVKSLKQGEKVDTLEHYLDPSMTEWEQGREQEEFFRAAVFYKTSNSTLSSRFTRAKYEDDVDKVEVPRDQENDIDDKETAVKMKMFGKLTRDKFEWHPDKLLCKRFNVPDPYPDSSIVGLPKVKRDKYSVFNFLTLPEATTSVTQATSEKIQQSNSLNKTKKPSRWDVSDKEKEKKDSISEFISLARSKADLQQQLPVSATEECGAGPSETTPAEGCNPLAETGRSKLQNQRAVLNQQILRAVRMRAGAENLLRATTNNKVREQVLLELSFVNSDLQILKEELEGLNISVEVYQNTEETFTIPLVPLGLKETKEVDFTLPLKDFILEHYSEDSSEYEDEIADLMDLRQACRTPSRDEAGIEMLISYFLQLGYIENRFFPPTRHMGVLFTWYDSFTGVPVCQQNLLLEKASILFNIGALYTQIATRCNRQTKAGLENAVDVFQRAAGVLSYLKETFTHTPSYDMSPAMLNVLVKLMLAQAQECVFEQIGLPGIRNEFFTLVKMTQEVAKVGEVYMLVNTAMNQEPVKENIPYSWSKLAQIKSDHYKALAHYFIATILCDHELQSGNDEDQQEKALSRLYDCLPEGLMVLTVLKDKVQRKQLGKAHLRRAVVYHEEALRVCGLCKKLRNIDVLQEVLTAAHKRSLLKYAQQETEDDFLILIQAPDIIPKTEHKIETIAPQFSKVKVKDFFHGLGPLTVFSAKQRWTAPRSILIHHEEGELGFSLKGGSPVQIYCLDPVCSAASMGLKEGDYIVSVGGVDCKWLGVNEVLEKFRSVGEQPIEIEVISCQDTAASMHNKSATYSVGMQKTYSLICLAMEESKIDQTKKAPLKLPFLSWGTKNRQKAASTLCLPSAVAGNSQIKKKLSPFTLLNSESSLY